MPNLYLEQEAPEALEQLPKKQPKKALEQEAPKAPEALERLPKEQQKALPKEQQGALELADI